MRIDKKAIAKILEYDICRIETKTDKERAIDYILYSFARLHGIGVYPVEKARHGNSIQYRFVSVNIQRYHDNNWHERPEDDGINVIINFNEVDDLERAMREVMKAAEYHYKLPHWEDYLEEKPKHDNGASYGFRANNYIYDEALMKHDDNLAAMYYGYGSPVVSNMQICYQPARGSTKSGAQLAYLKKKLEEIDHIWSKPISYIPEIDKVVFNEPATIVMWKDGTKTVVKAQDGEVYDPEKGLAMAICKKAMGNTRDYYILFKKYLKQWKKEHPEKDTVDVFDSTGEKIATLTPTCSLNFSVELEKVARALGLEYEFHSDMVRGMSVCRLCKGDNGLTIPYTKQFVSKEVFEFVVCAVKSYFNL